MSYHIHTLDSGLRLAFMPEDEKVTYMGFAVMTGTRHENKSAYGMAHLVEHMLFKGTYSRNSTHIIQRAEEVGAELNAYTTKEETFIYAALPQPYWQRIFLLLSDVVLNSRFPQDELDKEKTVIIDEINSYRDNPSELIYDEFENLLFAHTPLGHSILGSERSVNHISTAMSMRFMREHYKPSNMLFFVKGNVDEPRLIELAERVFGGFPVTPPSVCLPSPMLIPSRPQTVRHRRDTYQQHVMIGCSTHSMHSKERIPLSLLLNILGGPGMNSRLNMSLRERHGLVYNVEATYNAYSDTGILTVYFASAHKHVDQATELVYKEMKQLAETPLSEAQLSAAKRQAKGQLLIADDGRENVALSFAKSLLHYGKFDGMDTVLSRIDAVTAEQIRQIAAETLIPDRMSRLIYC
ncbi:MAG: pitrilysin family protein [Porphyromonas sp.]|nr:pitrilysin family protein [Porphyromonas sp.]